LDRRQILGIAYAASALGSWVYLIGPAANYMSYFPALSQIYITVSDISNSSTQSNTDVAFKFTVTNPTPYVGLEFQLISYLAILPNGTGNRVAIVGSGSAVLNGYVGIPASSSIDVPATFSTGLNIDQFQRLCSVNNNELPWTFEGVMSLGTRDGSLTVQFSEPATSQC